MQSMEKAFEVPDLQTTSGAFQLSEIQFSAELSANGDFKLLGTGVGVSANTALTFVLSRRDKSQLIALNRPARRNPTMPLENPTFEYRRPGELALQVIDQLGQAWNSLSPAAQVEFAVCSQRVAPIWFKPPETYGLARRHRHFQAGMRAAALSRFLFACETRQRFLRHQVEARLGASAGKAWRGDDIKGRVRTDRRRHRPDLAADPSRRWQHRILPPKLLRSAPPAQKLVDWFVKTGQPSRLRWRRLRSKRYSTWEWGWITPRTTTGAKRRRRIFLRAIKAFAPA